MLTTAISEPITIDALLQIPEDEPERLFTEDGLKVEFRTLAGRWYAAARTDREASDAVGHLTALYQRAKSKIDAGTWEQPHVRALRRTDGTRFDVRFRTKFAFELGEVLAGDDRVAYLIDPAHRDLFERAAAAVTSFAYADRPMQAAIASHLPSIEETFECVATTGRPAVLAMIVRKTPNLLCLADVLAHYGGRMDPKHVAWVLTRLHHLACWLQWSKRYHNDISLASVFISPNHHSVALLGGWWYATSGKETLRALPARTVRFMPSDVMRSKRSDRRIDQDLIRGLGRELLGDVPGMHCGALPEPMGNWLRTASAGNALTDYLQWESVRDKTFGERRFIPMNLTADHLYPIL